MHHNVKPNCAFVACSLLMWAAPSWCNDVLFSDTNQNLLKIAITLPLSELIAQRKAKQTVEGQLSVEGDSITLKITPRGKSRLERCRFPPLWLDLKKSTTTNTIFEDQNKLKLVTHCNNALERRGYLAAEMLAYRLFNLIHDTSFKVRPVEVTYNDTNKNKSATHHGFLIEHKKRLAHRLNLSLVEQKRLKRSALDPQYVSLANLFQYMIGNTDFSFSQGPPGDECCHNAVPTTDGAGSYFSIPYDFDSSGFVDPPYAAPANSLGLKRLTQRRYRGFCQHNKTLLQARQKFLAAKQSIFDAIINFDEIPNLNRKKATKFLEGFFKTIESDKNFQRKILAACRKG